MRKPNIKKKGNYKGPFQGNPNLAVQNIKKSMRPETDGPTIDTFSSIDSTTSIGVAQVISPKQPAKKIQRPTKERSKKFKLSTESIFLTIIGFAAVGIGIIVYDHSNKFASVEKDIEFIKEENREQKDKVESILKQTNEIDKKVDLLNQKIDMTIQKNNNRK